MTQKMWRIKTYLKYAVSRQSSAGLVDVTLNRLASLLWLSSSRSGLTEQNPLSELPLS